MSSGEAELYSLNRGAQDGLGIWQVSEEMGLEADVYLNTDATAARGIVQRSGAGRMKHVQVQEFWLQQIIRDGRAHAVKIPRNDYRSDVLTHHWERHTHAHIDMFARMGVES